MSKRKKGSNSFGLRLISIILGVFSLLGFLGTLGLPVGKNIYHLMTVVFGSNMAWVGLFLCLLFAVFLWIKSFNSSKLSSISVSTRFSRISPGPNAPRNSGAHRKVKANFDKSIREMEPSKGISLPAGKLVTLEGFNDYFSSPEWAEVNNDNISEGIEDIGNDFSSFFRSAAFSASKKKSATASLKGLDEYIHNVDKEEDSDQSIPEYAETRDKLESFSNKSSKSLNSSVFKTQAEQAEFLAQFKEEITPVEEVIDEINNEVSSEVINWDNIAKETTITINDLEKMTSNNQTHSSELLQEECTSELNELGSDQCLDEIASSSDLEVIVAEPAAEELSKEEIEVPLPPVTETKLNYAGQVAQLVNIKMNDSQKALSSSPELSATHLKQWGLPNINILNAVAPRIAVQDTETAKLLEKVLLDFGVKAKVIRVTKGPVITRYELAPAPGVKISKIVNLADDIALGLAARDVRIEAPIPGKAAVGIEVPNKDARSVPFREVLETSVFDQYASKLKVALGKDIADQPIIADLAKMPHLLVAGATGAGKSVCITTIINSILFNAAPDEVKFLLVDPKMVELSQYNGIPHLLAPVVIDPKKAANALKWIVKEMENRYELFAASGVRDIERYNKQKAEDSMSIAPALPFIVVIIDELADLMMVAAGEVEEAVCRLAQMARAAGIHLVIATQRPSVDVITGVIKANIPSRISFAVSSQIDSRTILDATGAEKLLGRGDMLYSPLGMNKPLRVQGCLVTDDEVQRVIEHWKGLGKPDYLAPERLFAETAGKNEENNGPDDALFVDAGQLFIRTGMASVSYLQRRLKLGYTRAARLMDMLEEQGVVGAYEGSKPRQVLLTMEEFNERFC